MQPGVFARRVRAIMKERGLRQADLVRAGIPRSTLTGQLRGDAPTPAVETVARFAEVLGVPTDALLKEETGELRLDEMEERFLSSEWAPRLQPPFDDEDRATLARLLGTWVGAEPDDEALFHLILAGRTGTL